MNSNLCEKHNRYCNLFCCFELKQIYQNSFNRISVSPSLFAMNFTFTTHVTHYKSYNLLQGRYPRGRFWGLPPYPIYPIELESSNTRIKKKIKNWKNRIHTPARCATKREIKYELLFCLVIFFSRVSNSSKLHDGRNCTRKVSTQEQNENSEISISYELSSI